MLAELGRCKYSWAPANRSGLHMAIAIGLGPDLGAIGFILDRFGKTLQNLRMLSSVTLNCQVTKIFS